MTNIRLTSEAPSPDVNVSESLVVCYKNVKCIFSCRIEDKN